MTGRAVSVSAAARNGLPGITVIAGIKNGPKGTASAITDIPDSFLVYFRHFVFIKLQILLSINPEDLLNGAHDNTPCINWATLS